ncbi:MAG: lasso peptide biosynthesis B2 protein [Pseudomonadales bacterium]
MLDLKYSEWRCLLWAVVALPYVDVILRWRGFASANKWAMVPLATSNTQDGWASAIRWGWVINGVAAHGPYRTTCLRRSLALLRYLRAHGLEGELRVGLPIGEAVSSTVEAHAWIELDGVVLNDRADVVQHYASFNLDGAH